ncbi:hypothetical protein A8B82_03230 [Sulfitobacter sp. EhC04]|uniref:endonuclease domain-containing protein n=1 Tax=Sulfitobacter sp. EhC04 TaxID=1849168 RepID=UPI0007F52179|nr:endonuclease domain-containing protein [Sulfitobacter sp. EhC04]OAN73522.1 hypothetical protein A8B82_03230 [Sulfitobacter sp. EhC04]
MGRTKPQISKARAQRRWMTAPEDKVWQALRNRQVAGLKFRRKAPLGPYVVDFLCPAARLVVEVTGLAQHRSLLVQRDMALQALGYGVVRLTRAQVENDLGNVLTEIAGIAHRRY